ncbi:WD40 repeat-like protein [Sanghuangporus baumii]|uniref:WD40 repeat-like protein n=1 Tax=Sanghuangporus baumii TaxID=108892 RepID=A0A9Q5N9Q7_SANBA|nr:WD40 repeat-like protein [Sanghuangporus baumii]
MYARPIGGAASKEYLWFLRLNKSPHRKSSMSTSSSGDQPLSPETFDHASQTNKKRSSRGKYQLLLDWIGLEVQCRPNDVTYDSQLATNAEERRANAESLSIQTDPARIARLQSFLQSRKDCTFQGPSYKRGPPKGYISAIEQRLHQVEAVLGAIINSKDAKSQEITSALRTDDIAREIIDRVDRGPYGSTSRATSAGPADFSATIRQLNESRDNRTTRDSRVTRENLSSTYHDIPSPSPEWLRRLDIILAGQGPSRYSAPPSGSSSLERGHTDTPGYSCAIEGVPGGHLNISEMHAHILMPRAARNEDVVEKVEDEEAIGSLSFNENDEIRYHNESSELYFTYVHPDLPVLHKPSFMALCQSHLDYDSDTAPTFASTNLQTKLAQLLMLAVFTVSSRFNEREMSLPEPGGMWEAGCNYLASARQILYSVIHTSSIITCQALVILAYREFGLGSFEQSSGFMSMAINMAQDLGLHRAADRWQRSGIDIFSPNQKQERKHVWWSCAIAEKYIACALGKPTIIRPNDYDTDLPEDRGSDPRSSFGEEVEVWQPHPAVVQSSPQPPVLCHTLSTFKAAASLSVITGKIIDKIYSIRQKPWPKKQRLLYGLDRELNDWFAGLPAHLHYDAAVRRPVPPQTLFLHIQHSIVMILLHRKFIPRVNHRESAASAHGIDTAKEFEPCQEAAIRISSLAATIREVFSLKAVSAYLPSYLMSAGIMHLAAISMNRGDTLRSIVGIRNTLVCLKDMENVWPSAMRNYELLGSAWSKLENSMQTVLDNPDQFPHASQSFGPYNPAEAEENTRVMARLLGLEIPGVVHAPIPPVPWARGPMTQHVQGSAASSQTAYSPASTEYSRSAGLTPSSRPLDWTQEYPDSSIPFHGPALFVSTLMSSLRELLNPERPESFSQQSTVGTPSPSTRSTPIIENVDNNVLAHESLVNLDPSYTNYPGSDPSLVENMAHPPHENCPDSLDCLPDTNDRPQHTLPVILRCAILGSAKRKLTIRDIYAAMEKKYPYYRTAGPAWKQSVRHHLSLSRLFERKAKPVTEPGFGSYWTVNLDAPPGTKRPRKRGRQNKSANPNQNSSLVAGVGSSTERRGRPKKYAPQDFEIEQISKPSPSSLHVPSSILAGPQISSGNFAIYQLPVNRCSSQQFRLHSVHDMPSPHVEHDDDEKMFDTHDDYAEQDSPTLTDDADGSIDNRSEERAIYSYSGDPRTLPPPSLSSVPVDPTLITNYSEPIQHISRLRDEIRELQGRVASLYTEKSKMERELGDARAEIARLRAENEALERRSRNGTISRNGFHDNLIDVHDRPQIFEVVDLIFIDNDVVHVPLKDCHSFRYEKARVIGPLHTGGPVALASDGRHVITCVGDEALLTRLSDGTELRRFIADSETIHSLCLTPSSSHLIVFTASLSLHYYEDPLSLSAAKSLRPTRTIHKAHEAPVHVCKSDPTSSLLASGSADGVVKVWDIRRGYVTHIFKGHGGVVSALLFRYVRDTSTVVNTQPELHLISASVDTCVRIFDLSPESSRSGNAKPIAVLEGHVSVPRALDVTSDGKWLISGGRDSVVLLWNLLGNSTANKKMERRQGRLAPVLVRTVPILERVEAAGWVDDGIESLKFFTAGEKGVLRVWDAQSGTSLYALNEEPEEDVENQREILEVCCLRDKDLILSIHADQNILLHSLSGRTLLQQLIGFNDEITATSFLSATSPDSHVVVAANSSLIRVYSVSGNDSRLLPGHTGIVLCLASSEDRSFLASGSKDKSARLWSFSRSLSAWMNVAVCEGHAESVGAIALSQKTNESGSNLGAPRFMFTGSQDRTIKMWDLSSVSMPNVESSGSPVRCKSLTTHKAHDKDINSLDVSPNDCFLASASQDRTAKVYEIEYSLTGPRGEIKLLGTCKGHKRGVWTVKFGKVERVLATGSGDKTIKLWNLDDFTCIKTFEGHTNSVLQIDFFNQDMQLASTASDGLLKLWNVRTEECISTMDGHDDKVWALAISSDESMIVTGAADSAVTIWKDCTREKELEKLADREKIVMKEQDFMNYLTMKDYRNAISLAIAMDQPGRLYSLFKQILSPELCDPDAFEAGSVTGMTSIDMVLRKLPPTELASLLRHIRDWNVNAKTSSVAQSVLNSLLKLRAVEEFAHAFDPSGALVPIQTTSPNDTLSLSELVQALIPYTERHLARLDHLVQDSYILDYVLAEMDGGLTTEEDGMELDF